MADFIPWNEPKFGDAEKKLVCEVLESGFVSEGGPMTKKLEQEIKDRLGVKYVSFTTSGTAALYLAIKADQEVRGYSDGYEVIVPDFTFIATATAVNLARGKPVFADIDRDRFCIDPESVKNKINEKTKAIIVMHMVGRSCNMPALEKIAKDNNLILIEDSAACLTGRNETGYLGTFGKLGCFSLQANKIISSGQGGVIVTNDSEYYETILKLKDQGRVRSKEKRDEPFHEIMGHNFKSNEISLAVALGQWQSIEQKAKYLIAQREQYVKELSGVPQVVFPKVNSKVGEIPIYIDALVQKRDDLAAYLDMKGISSRKSWPPIHKTKVFEGSGTDGDFPVSTYVAANSLWFPNGPTVTPEQITRITQTIKEFYKKID